jgi:hypothetical protein
LIILRTEHWALIVSTLTKVTKEVALSATDILSHKKVLFSQREAETTVLYTSFEKKSHRSNGQLAAKR